ncbi:uncharacterized protein [Halyomorpha halys]|uniref:uncharacterized protein n=1 Tax=Halyomorpha halys TaxID=286706 RepID=UPI0034D2EBB4
MSALIGIFLVFLQFSYGLKIEEHEDCGELVFTSILYRHGERTPEVPYTNDPYKNDSYWPIGWGQLTNNGKRQHFELGKWLRNRYLSLIRDGKYNTNLVYVRSTDMDRTLMSAESNLAGMFYPTTPELWNNVIKWQPVPVHTIPQKLDKLLSMEYPCPSYREQYDEFYNSGLMKVYNEKNQELYDYLTKHAGEAVDDPIKVQWLYSTLYIQTLNNYPLPEWTKEVFPDKMYGISAFGFKMPVYTKTLKRLFSGPLLKNIIEQMKAKRSGRLTPNRNISIYSAHDTTVSALLETMGVFETHMPPFIATVLVELRKKNEQFYVSVFYKNSTAEPSLLTIPGCTSSCPLDYFETLLTDVIPKNWDAECKTLVRKPIFDQPIPGTKMPFRNHSSKMKDFSASAFVYSILFFNVGGVLSQRNDLRNDTELVFTSIVYRHGERNPNSVCPNDIHRDLSYWPEGLGMLTDRGKYQHYELGKWLRKRYDSLIPGGKYSKDLIYVQSSDWDRTLMSAQSNLAGMFPPAENQFSTDLDWQPIPVHTIPSKLDKLIAVQYPCPRLKEEWHNIKHSPIVKRYNKVHQKLYTELTKNCGETVDSPRTVGNKFITLLIETLRNYTIPDWAKDVFPDTLYRVTSFSFQMRTMTDTMRRLRGGPLLKDIITHMKQKRDGTLKPNRNLWVYSGHDTTVAALLDTMRVFKPHVPLFAATIMVELRKNQDNDHFVSVYYKPLNEQPELLTISGCDPLCPLDRFESLLSNVIPVDWNAECKATSSEEVSSVQSADEDE